MLRHEASSGGSPLNFVGSIHTSDTVADAYERALDTGKLEIYIPYSDSVTTRFVAAVPALIPRLLPTLNRIGERGQARYKAQKGLT